MVRLLRLALVVFLLFSLGAARLMTAQDDLCTLSAITDGVGTVTHSASDAVPPLVIIGEAHNSILGQLQSAVMLVRLKEHCNMDYIGLEGAFSTRAPLDAGWFNSGQDDIQDSIAVSFLADGEINQGEFAALVWHNEMLVAGIDYEARYFAPEVSENAVLDLLQAMSLVLMPMDLYAELVEVFDDFDALDPDDPDYDAKADELIDRYVEIVYRSDDWISKQYDLLMSDLLDTATSELVERYSAIIARAESMRAAFQSEIGEDVDTYITPVAELIDFYRAVDDRTVHMIDVLLRQHAAAPATIMTMITGAAHTPLARDLLDAQDIDHAVINPLALNDTEGGIDLVYEAFECRYDPNRSVDGPTGLGYFLAPCETRINPPPRLAEDWMQAKAYSYAAINAVVTAALGPEPRPEDTEAAVNATIAGYPFVSLVPGTIEIIPAADDAASDNVIFALNIESGGPAATEVWFRAAYSDEGEFDLEEALLAAIDRIREANEEVNPGQPSAENPEVPAKDTRFTSNVSGFAASDRAGAMSRTVGGR